MKIKKFVLYFLNSRGGFIKNSIWGLISTILQTVFLSLFFVIVSRQYSKIDFANYLIATTLYQLMVGLSSMGLGIWFIREVEHNIGAKSILIRKFIKIQIGLGLLFYLLNMSLIYILYPNGEIRLLGLILGANIIFDNIIYALRSINIAEAKQKKTAIIMTLDAFLRLIIICVLFIIPFSITFLCLLLVLIRIITVNIFIKIGIDENLNIWELWHYKIYFKDIKAQVLANWRFIIIAGVSIVFWRSATIIISKFLSSNDLTNYEVSYKIFSIFLIIPIIASSTIYPQFVKLFIKNNYLRIRELYNSIFFIFTAFSLVSYVFILTFSDLIILFVFGEKFALAAACLQEMFLTFLVFPTVLLQANLIVAIKLERMDMYFNMIALAINFIACFIGLYFFKSLSVINYSIFGAFLVFHIIQNILLIKLKITSIKHTLIYYFILFIIVLLNKTIIDDENRVIVFVLFGLICTTIVFFYLYKNLRSNHKPELKRIL